MRHTLPRIALLGLVCLFCGCVKRPEFLAQQGSAPSVLFQLRKAQTTPGPGLKEQTVRGQKVYVHGESMLSNGDVRGTSVSRPKPTEPAPFQDEFLVDIYFTEEGAKKLRKLTEDCIGQPVAILIDGTLVAAPHVLEKIVSGHCQISGFKDADEAERVAKGIVGATTGGSIAASEVEHRRWLRGPLDRESYDHVEGIFRKAWQIDLLLGFFSLFVWLACWYVLYQLSRLKFLRLIIAGDLLAVAACIVRYQHVVTGFPRYPSWACFLITGTIWQTFRVAAAVLSFAGVCLALRYLLRKWDEMEGRQPSVGGDGEPAPQP